MVKTNNMAQQTAVDWLQEQMLWNEFHNPYLEQAKQMFEQQIIDAASDHCYPSCEIAKIDAEEYYNKTFKKQ